MGKCFDFIKFIFIVNPRMLQLFLVTQLFDSYRWRQKHSRARPSERIRVRLVYLAGHGDLTATQSQDLQKQLDVHIYLCSR